MLRTDVDPLYVHVIGPDRHLDRTVLEIESRDRRHGGVVDKHILPFYLHYEVLGFGSVGRDGVCHDLLRIRDSTPEKKQQDEDEDSANA